MSTDDMQTAAGQGVHPTVPNDTAALDALPVGTVLRGDAREGSWHT